ncbi:MAG: diguanylate cyclase [Bacillota bacterium]|nr:diguanylate cyclase [Bacillota bacterium]
MKDITDKNLRNLLVYNNSLFNCFNDAVVFYDQRGEINGCNNKFYELLDIPCDLIKNNNIFGMLKLAEEEIEFVSSGLEGKIAEKDIVITSDSGTTLRIMAKTGPLSSPENKIIGGYLVLIDPGRQKEELLLLKEREDRLLQLVNKARLGVVSFNQDHKVIECNQRFVEMMGYSIDEMMELYTWDIDAFNTEEDIRKNFSDLSKANVTIETKHLRKDGSTYDVEVHISGTKVKGSQGEYNASICICQDISERKRMERELQLSELKLRNFVENASDIICTLTIDGKVSYISPNVKKVMGYDSDEIENQIITTLFQAEEIPLFKKHLQSTINKSKHNFGDFQIRHKDNSIHWYGINFSSSVDHDVQPIVICNIRNIDGKKEAEESLRFLSLHDQLTGVYNRTFFEKEMKKQIEAGDYPLTLLSCDLDGLKIINDEQGHAAGDELLKDCTRVLQSSLRNSDFLARIGGDEFAIILPATDEKAAQKILDRINNSIDRHNLEKQNKISISIGTATIHDKSLKLSDALIIADKNMYCVKNKKRYTDPEA